MLNIPINDKIVREVRELLVYTLKKDEPSSLEQLVKHIEAAAEVEARNVCLDASDTGDRAYARGTVRGMLGTVAFIERCILEAKRLNRDEDQKAFRIP